MVQKVIFSFYLFKYLIISVFLLLFFGVSVGVCLRIYLYNLQYGFLLFLVYYHYLVLAFVVIIFYIYYNVYFLFSSILR